MPHFRTAVVSMASALALAACSSSDSNGNGGGSASSLATPDRPDVSSLETVSQVQQGAEQTLTGLGDEQPYGGDLVALLEDIRDASTDTPTDTALAGQASYAGGVTADDGQGSSLLADLSMDVDFNDGSVDGEVSGLRTLGDGGTVESIDGTASIQGDVTGNALEADIDGQVSAGGVDAIVRGTMAGEFRGTNAEEVVGATSLNINASDVDGIESFDGGFHATQQTTP